MVEWLRLDAELDLGQGTESHRPQLKIPQSNKQIFLLKVEFMTALYY